MIINQALDDSLDIPLMFVTHVNQNNNDGHGDGLEYMLNNEDLLELMNIDNHQIPLLHLIVFLKNHLHDRLTFFPSFDHNLSHLSYNKKAKNLL